VFKTASSRSRSRQGSRRRKEGIKIEIVREGSKGRGVRRVRPKFSKFAKQKGRSGNESAVLLFCAARTRPRAAVPLCGCALGVPASSRARMHAP
jgi:hypothetical protein